MRLVYFQHTNSVALYAGCLVPPSILGVQEADFNFSVFFPFSDRGTSGPDKEELPIYVIGFGSLNKSKV